MPTSSAFTKRVQHNDKGNENSWGSDDTDLIYATLSGEKNVGPATIESNWAFRNQNLRMQTPAKSFEYIVNTSNLTGDRNVFEPSLTGDDTRVYENHPQTLMNKTISSKDNTIEDIVRTPISAKHGWFQAVGEGGIAGGDGILQTMIHMAGGNPVEARMDDNEGTFYRYFTSSIASETSAGVRVPTQLFTRSKFNPTVVTKFRLPQWSLGNMRFYCGLAADSTLHQSDTPLAATVAGFLFGIRPNDGDFKLFRNVGDGTTVTSPFSSAHSVNQDVHTIRMGARNDGTQIFLEIDENGTEHIFSTDMPQTTQNMTFHMVVQNIDTLTAPRQLDIFHINVESDR